MTSPDRAAGRRVFALGALAVGLPGWAGAQREQPPLIEVWKSPTSGCCREWVAHVQASGFRIKINETGNTAARARLGIAERFGSCHTAVVGGYAIEGHVPAAVFRRYG